MSRNNYISTLNMPRNEWLKLRKKLGIGGSEAAAILGYSPYKTAVDVWIDKTSQLISHFDNEAMWIGRQLEDVIRKRFVHEKGLKVFDDHKIRLHKEHKGLFCNLDGLISNPDEGPGVFEAKAFLSYEMDKYDSVIPPPVYLQVQHNMNVCDYDYGYAAILVKDRNEFVIQRINRNQQLIDDMTKRLLRFWEYNVQGYHAPAPVNEDDLKKLYSPGNEGETVVADEKVYEQWRELIKVRQEQKHLSNKEDMLRYQLESFMAEAEILKDQQGETLATWKTSSKFDHNKLADEEPELYARYCTRFDRSSFKKNHAAKYDKYKQRNGSRRFLPKTK